MSFFYDCHIHTSEVSRCGKIPGVEIAERYHRANYSGIVITDHYFESFFQSLQGSWEEQVQAYLVGYKQAKARGQELGLEVLLGLELRFTGTSEDYLVYGVDKEFLISYPRLDQYDLASFYSLAQKHNLLVVQAHPFRPGLRVASPKLIDGIEVFNGNPRHNSQNELALRYAKKHDLIQIACSDAHQVQDVAQAWIEVPIKIGTSAELVSILRANPVLPRKPKIFGKTETKR